MAGLSLVIAIPFRLSSHVLTGSYGALEVVIGLTTMGVGIWVLCQGG
jgi:hypothetical protein